MATTRPGAGRPDIRVDQQDRTSVDVVVTGAEKPFWLVLGQSHNLGWTATSGGRDLGEPTLVNGYANGWQVPAGQTVRVHLEWTPQKVVWGAIFASVFSVLIALVLVLWPRRTPATAAAGLDPTHMSLDARPAMPRAFRVQRLLRYSGPAPSRFAKVGTVLGSLAIGGAVIGPIYGLVLAALALLVLQVRRARPILTIGAPLVFAGCVGTLMAIQLFRQYPSGFEWPSYFDVVQQPAWLAVSMLLLDAVVDRCWLRRWWPTEDSPTGSSHNSSSRR